MQEQHESTIRNISKEIKRECFRNNISIQESFISFYVELLYLNPDHGISANILSNRDAVVAFVKMVVEQIKKQNSPYFITLKMQWYFNDLMKSKDEVVKDERDLMERHTKTLKYLILKRNQLDTDRDVIAYKKKIVCYASLKIGLGNPMEEPVFKEGLYALRSIMDDSEIREFAALPMNEKEEQLQIIISLISGIRLFNMDTKKGGMGIPDLPDILKNSRVAIKQHLDEILGEAEDKIDAVTSILDNCYKFDKTDIGRSCIKLEVPPEATEAEITYLRDFLVAFRQYEMYIRAIVEVLHVARLKVLLNEYQKNSDVLYNICHDRVAVSSTKVFPLFEKHTEIWLNLQNQGLYLIHASNIIKTLTQCLVTLHYPERMILQLLNNCQVTTDALRRSKELEPFELPSDLSPDQFYILPTVSTHRENKMFLHGMGYDLFKFAHTDGLLIPGSFTAGIGVSLNKVRSLFSDARSITGFIESVDESILRSIDLLRRRVMFINLFGLKYLLQALADEKISIERIGKKKSGISVECQTEFDNEEGYIDPNYMWNIWDWKRQAIQLANLTQSRTVSTQTEEMGGSVAIQTNAPKEVAADTKRDNYTNVEKPSRFIFGLRGRKDDKQFDIDLTRPVSDE